MEKGPGIAALILSKKKPEDESADDKKMSYDSAAKEILDAIEAKSAKDLSEALKSFYDMCSSEAE